MEVSKMPKMFLPLGTLVHFRHLRQSYWALEDLAPELGDLLDGIFEVGKKLAP